MYRYSFRRAVVLVGCMIAVTACTKKEVYVELKEAPKVSLMQYIQNNFTLSSFYAALKKTGLDKMLEERDSLTVLVPDNDAFKSIGVLSAADLDRLNTDSLKKALEYHILPQKILYNSIPQTIDNEYKNITGNNLYFSRELPRQYPNVNNKGHVNGAAFKYIDNLARNGVIHILDRPLKPAAPSVRAFLEADTTYTYFIAALKKFGLYEQLDKDGPITLLAVPNEGFRMQNISLDSISRMDTARLKRYLFSVYVLNPNRIYVSHFEDAPGTKDGPNGLGNYIFSKDGILYFQYFKPTTYIRVYGYGRDYGLPDWQYPSLGGGFFDPATILNADNTTANGVVHRITKLILYPNEMKK